jgi:PhnB protein
MKPYKPGGYTSVSPYLVVQGAQRMVDLLRKVFNAETLRRYDNDDGTIMHVEVKIDDAVVMLADSNDQYPPNKSLIHVYVPDVDDVFKKALAEGCQAMEAPRTRDGDPDRRGSFLDFSGNIWAVGTQQS